MRLKRFENFENGEPDGFDGESELKYINSRDTLIQKAGIVTKRTEGRKFPSTSFRKNPAGDFYSFQFEEDLNKFKSYLDKEGIDYEISRVFNTDNWIGTIVIKNN